MGDMGEVGQAMQQARKDRHAEWKRLNMEQLALCGLAYRSENHGENMIFRIDGYPKADFFPSTGRWRSQGKTYRGGARAFLQWMKVEALRSGKKG